MSVPTEPVGHPPRGVAVVLRPLHPAQDGSGVADAAATAARAISALSVSLVVSAEHIGGDSVRLMVTEPWPPRPPLPPHPAAPPRSGEPLDTRVRVILVRHVLGVLPPGRWEIAGISDAGD